MSQPQTPIRTGLLELLRKSVGVQFVIPVYQRNYTWTINKDVKKFYEDLKALIDKKNENHFLGIMIYLDKSLSPYTREFSIIDGQQRLTTTFLFLYAMKELLIENGKEQEAEQLISTFLINTNTPTLKYKLKPLVADDEVYSHIVNGNSSEVSGVKSNVSLNFFWIKGELMNLINNGVSFDEILEAFDKLYLVCVPITEGDNPQKIFESINSTGEKLTSSDLIRNYVLMDLTSEVQERYYSDYWKKIEANISTDSKKLELFFRMLLAAKNKNLSSTQMVYNDFKEWYSNELTSREDESILKEIVKYSKYFNNLYIKPINDVDPALRAAVKEFRTYISDMPAPLFIELYDLYETKNEDGERLISTEQFSYIILLINSYLVRRAICDKDTSAITKLFPSILGNVLNDCKGDYTNIVEYARKHVINNQKGKAAEMPNDSQMNSFLEYGNVYNLRVVLKVVLDKIEHNNNSAPVDLTKLSIEHLTPQTPTKEWLDVFGNDELLYNQNLHRLGNLTLATKVDNSKMGNKPFDYKREILKDTAHLIMNKEILDKETWGFEEIDERNKNLIKVITALYPYTPAPTEFISRREISLDWDGIVAFAYLYEEDGTVEIQTGSQVVKYDSGQLNEEWYFVWYKALLEEGYIQETDEGAVFIKPLLVYAQKENSTALSATAGLLLCGNRNGWDYWRGSNGKRLNQDKNLYNKLRGI